VSAGFPEEDKVRESPLAPPMMGVIAPQLPSSEKGLSGESGLFAEFE